MAMFRRGMDHAGVTIAASGHTSGAIDFCGKSFMVVHMPAAWTAASLAFQVCALEGGTYTPLYDDDGNLLEIAASASKSFTAPSAIAGCAWVRLWSETSGSNVTQDAERSFAITMKS